jgi:outer membrane protein TolC
MRRQAAPGRLGLAAAFFLLAALCAGRPTGAAGDGGPGGVLTVSEGLMIATEKNRVLRIASKEAEVSLEDARVARSRLYPRIDASLKETFLAYQPGVDFEGMNAYTEQKTSLSYEITVRQTLYKFGANSSLYEASKNSLEAQRLTVELVRNQVALDFIVAYLDLLEAEKTIALAEREVERLESHLADAKSLYAEGVITRNDLLQAEVRLSDARQRLLSAVSRRAIEETRLNSILARPLGTRAEVEDVGEPLAPQPDLEAAWRAAEEGRAELMVLEEQMRAAGFEEAFRRSAYFPEFFAQGGYSYTENRFLLEEDNWSFILGLNMNLYGGGGTRAEVARARLRREQLREQREKLLEDIRVEVHRNFLDAENARERIGVTEGAVGQAEENLRINRIRYEEGVGTATEVIDAVALLSTAETNHLRAVYELRRARARLMFSMGLDMVSAYTP